MKLQKNTKSRKKTISIIFYITFILYVALLLQVTVLRIPMPFYPSLSVVYAPSARFYYANFIPGHTLLRFCREIVERTDGMINALLNLGTNLVVFVPFGFL